MTKKVLFVVVVITLLFIGMDYFSPRHVHYSKEYAQEFILGGLDPYHSLAELLIQDYQLISTENHLCYIVSYDTDGASSIVRCNSEYSDYPIYDRNTMLQHLTAISDLQFRDSRVWSIHVNPDRISFCGAEASSIVIYMRNPEVPSYYLSPESKMKNYFLYGLCDRWYYARPY